MADALPRQAVVAVIGAGAMGAGIAQVAALYGHRVQLHDARFGAGDEGRETIRQNLTQAVAKNKVTAIDADAALQRISTVVTLPDCCVAALIVEAIVEDLNAKRELFQSLEHVISHDCILASNTSSLSIAALGSGLRHPGRVVGMHFFNPVPLMPLVEVVAGPATDAAATETIFATAVAWGKTPVRAASTPGFIVNRCARPFYGEALRLLAERAAEPATIDAVMREAGGFRMGPFELMDLIGHDVNFAVTKNVWEASFNDPRFAPSVLQQERLAAGFLGRKSGRGFYRYGRDIVQPAPQTEPPGPPPGRIIAHGVVGNSAALVDRLAGAGVAIDHADADSRLGGFALQVSSASRDEISGASMDQISGAPMDQISNPHRAQISSVPSDVWLAPSDGRTATARAVSSGVRDLVVYDLAFDYAKATRLAVARADTCSEAALSVAAGALQAAGLNVSRFDDVAGLAVLRTVAMLVNEAADAVVQGVADPAAVDLAMQKGVNYPLGPLTWGDAIGVGAIRSAILHLAAHYGEDRYRLSPLIARRALTGDRLCG